MVTIMLITGTFHDIGKVKCDEIWCIVRSLKNGLPNADVPIYHVPDLSPSFQLFKNYLAWRDQGVWNLQTFEQCYKPRFMQEMCNVQALAMLNRLYEKSKVMDILIVCFCPDESMCHRSLVKQIIASMDYFYALVAGSRTFGSYDVMCHYLDHFLQNHAGHIVIVSGGARGADSMAERYADEHGCLKVIMPAQWDTYGKSAGFRRNEAMHQYIARFPHRGCICFWDGQSKGTAHNFELCQKYSTPLRTVRF